MYKPDFQRDDQPPGLTSRRRFLRTAGLGLATPFLLLRGSDINAAARGRGRNRDKGRRRSRGRGQRRDPFQYSRRRAAESVFALSVASGDPSPSGVVLWTRISPTAYESAQSLAVEVARDAAFTDVVVQGVTEGQNFGPGTDYTVHVDLDGELAADSVYYYRFIYNQTQSRTGRCRTLPQPDAAKRNLKLALLTCQDFSNGYFGALGHLAATDQIDFVVHLGDFIYESAAYAVQDFPDRGVVLPSGKPVAFDLRDFRAIYRRYREDSSLRAAMERHTWIHIWDDHETANDCYWDYSRDTLGAPDHPFQVSRRYGNNTNLLRLLKLDAQRAWAEYVPTRMAFDSGASHPFDALQIYRSFRFGDLVELFMTDERTYRSEPPCGLGTFGERYFARDCDERSSPGRTMLGRAQREWLVEGLTGSPAIWKAWGNQVFLGELALGDAGPQHLVVNNDAWDGYVAERDHVLRAVRESGMRNLVAMTGDLHSFMASYIKLDHTRRSNLEPDNVVGVEFMTPSITSAGVAEVAGVQNPPVHDYGDATLNRILPRYFLESIVRSTNPHVRFFNSQDFGLSTIEFNREYCEWTAYKVNKFADSPSPHIEEIHKFRVPRDNPVLALGPVT